MTTYRAVTSADLSLLAQVAAAMGDVHETGYYARCLAEQTAGNRTLFLALSDDGSAAGYIQLIWSPAYAPFRRLDIPEIQDLCVVPAARRQGIGEALVKLCEALARETGRAQIGLGVGLDASFGAAQRLYVRLGYMPDGFGAAYDEVTVRKGEMRAFDHLLTLKFLKDL